MVLFFAMSYSIIINVIKKLVYNINNTYNKKLNMKTYIKVSGIIIVILISLILLKYVHIIVGVTFFVIGMGLLVYYGFIKKNDKYSNVVNNNLKNNSFSQLGQDLKVI